MITDPAAVRPMRRDAVRNQQLVIAAAREVLSEFGEQASMEQIACRAGVGVGTIYRHYPNKAALFSELVRIIGTDLMDAAHLALGSGDGSGLGTFLTVVGTSLFEHRGYSDKLMEYADDERNRRLRGFIADLLTQAQTHGTISSSVTFDDVMATIAGLRGVITSRQGTSADAEWQRYLQIHLVGLRAL